MSTIQERTENDKPSKLLILIPWYEPAYKAGGPIKSVRNLLQVLESYKLRIHLMTSCYDLDATTLAVENTNTWLTRSFGKINYRTQRFVGLIKMQRILASEGISRIYINGVYNWSYNIAPLICGILSSQISAVVVAPRGMLQAGAIQGKKVKKTIFLQVLRLLITEKVLWHATDNQEKLDIIDKLGVREDQITVIGNIPDVPQSVPTERELSSSICLGVVSRLTYKKGILNLIEELQNVDINVNLKIWGSFEDEGYERNVRDAVKGLPSHIRVEFNGHIHFGEVRTALESIDYFVSLTKGENFGHSIYEALSYGVPVIISPHTPWSMNVEKGGGFIWRKKGQLKKIISCISNISHADLRKQRLCALDIARNYYNELAPGDYLKMLYKENE